MSFAKNPLHKSVKGAFCILLGVLSAMSFAISPENYAGMSAVPAAATSYLWSALAACFAWALYQVFCKKGEKENENDTKSDPNKMLCRKHKKPPNEHF